MTQDDPEGREIDRDAIIDRIYNIAVEPSALDGFINLWHDMDLADHFAEGDGTPHFDSANTYNTHLRRADAILQRDDTLRPDFSDVLRPYKTLAAWIVSATLDVRAANPGAQKVYRLAPGDPLDQINLPEQMRAALADTARTVLSGKANAERILKAKLNAKGGTILFRVIRLDDLVDTGPTALIVSTHFHWQDAYGTFLNSVFELTDAEQDIARKLVDGLDIKAIADARESREGTVRGQIKSITRKMNVRTQTDVVRLIMTLGEFPTRPAGIGFVGPSSQPLLANNWLEAEVWKPFKEMMTPSGRSLVYHDMGPSTGNPVLLSHMGSCMVRWPASMVRLAYENNLRVICPIRAGYGHTETLKGTDDPIAVAREDSLDILDALGVERVPYVAQGTDFAFASDMVNVRPDRISEIVGIGARPCLPGGGQINGAGRWESFFVSTARHAPHLAQFAAQAVMAMCKRIGPEAMLRQLCKEAPSDLRLLEDPNILPVLVANIGLMAGRDTNAARAFASEYMAFQKDWSESVQATRSIPVQLLIAAEDPTINISALPELVHHYPWMTIDVIEMTGLALMYQAADKIVPLIAEAGRRAVSKEVDAPKL